jgi:hypothetical protein
MFRGALFALLFMLPLTAPALSPECQADQETLANNTALVAAIPPTRMCEVVLGQTSSCSVDYSKASSEFERLCLQAGAQFHEIDLTMDCRITEPYSGKTYNADYYFTNNPACLGQRCTIEDFQQELDSTVYPALEQQLAQAGFQCNVSAGTSNLGDTILVYMLTLMTGTWAIATALW